MIDQRSFHNLSVNASSGASIPIIDHSQLETKNVGASMYPSLMGTFSFPAPILIFGSSLGRASTLLNSVSIRTFDMEDPWILPSPSTLSDNSVPSKMDMSLPTTVVVYQENLDHVVEPSTSSS